MLHDLFVSKPARGAEAATSAGELYHVKLPKLYLLWQKNCVSSFDLGSAAVEGDTEKCV